MELWTCLNIGVFKIISESSLASGVRRIEAITGNKAHDYFNKHYKIVNKLKNTLKCNDEEIIDKIEELKLKLKTINDKNEKLNKVYLKNKISELFKKNSTLVNDIKVVNESVNIEINPQLMGDIVREELKDKGIALISSHLDKPRVMCIITKDICEVLDAGNIIRNIADKIGLKGGGSKHFAMINLLDKNLLDKSIKIGLDIINKRCSEYAN